MVTILIRLTVSVLEALKSCAAALARDSRPVGALVLAGAAAASAHGATVVDTFNASPLPPAWTFVARDNLGNPPTTGTSFTGLAGSVGAGYLKMSHSTVALKTGGGGAATLVGSRAGAVSDGTVRAVINANPNEGHKSQLGIVARGSSNTGSGYVLFVDFNSGHLVLGRADGTAIPPSQLASQQIATFIPTIPYLVELTFSGSSFTGRVFSLNNTATPLNTITATDLTYATGTAGVYLRTGTTPDGTPQDAIVGTYDDFTILDTGTGGGGVPVLTSVAPIIRTSNSFPVSTFDGTTFRTSLENTVKERYDFVVEGAALNSTVRIYADDTLIAQQPAPKGGRVLLRSFGIPQLAQGTYSLGASQVIGNVESQKIIGFLLEVDTTPPPAPSAPVLDSASDSGPSNTDGVTKETTLVLKGTADPGSVVLLFAAGKPSKVPSTTADISGAYTFNVTGVKAGTYKLSAVAIDTVGNFSPQSGQTVVQVITKAPKAPSKLALLASDVLPPPPGQKKSKIPSTANPRPTVTGKGVKNAIIEVFTAGSRVGMGNADDKGNFAIALTQDLIPGEQSLTAAQLDPAGNASVPSKALIVNYVPAAPAPFARSSGGEALDGDSPASSGLPKEWIARFDLTGDGVIDGADLRVVASWAGSAIGDDPPEGADADGDGHIDAEDIAIFAALARR